MDSKRIIAIASLVPLNSITIDVGTDHAYLPIYLIKNHIVKKSLASDISSNALEMAKKNIKRYNLDTKIKIFQSDGLEGIEEKYDTVILSGMGTKTIKKILHNHLDIKNIIVQSNNDLAELRKFFNQNNYQLSKEIVVFENNFYYPIIKYIKGHENLMNKYILFGKSFDLSYLNYLKKKYILLSKKVPLKKKILYYYYLLILNSLLKEHRI